MRILMLALMVPVVVSACSSDDGPAPDFVKLSADVTVIRDGDGVPHIYGATDADVGYAAGYEQARDRLFQMDLLRRQAAGRLAEVFGETYHDVGYASQDLLLRAVGFYRSAQTSLDWMRLHDKVSYTMLSGYAAGVSAFIADAVAGRNGLSLPYGFRPSELGYTPEPWTPLDSVAIGKLQAWGLSSSVSYELLSSLIQYVLPPAQITDLVSYAPPEPVFILDGFPGPATTGSALSTSTEAPAPAAARPRLVLSERDLAALFDRALETLRTLSPFGLQAGSNNWVVSGQHTATGKPILCNDPHLPLTSPTTFYYMHLNTADRGGELDVAGVTFPGVPVVAIGHNRRVAWGATVARGDVADIFAEKLSTDHLKTVHDTGEEPLQTINDNLRVRRADAPYESFDLRPITIQVVPRHGPVLPAESTIPPSIAGADLLSFAWTGNNVSNEIGAFGLLNRARDLSGFKRAVSQITTGAQNFVYADADGHIAYSARAVYPLRKRLDAAKPPWFIVPGSGAYDWADGGIPDDRVPQAIDPPAGFVATANNDPVGTTRDNNPLNDAYYLGPLYDPGYRAWRISTELTRLVAEARANPARRITTENMRALQLDTYLRVAARLLPHLQAAWDAAATTPELMAFRDDAMMATMMTRFATWDLRASAESAEAAVFHLWLGYFGASTLRDEIGGAIFDRAVKASPDVMLRPLVFLADNPVSGSGKDYFDDIHRDGVQTREQIALEALASALTHATRVLGTADVTAWRYSDLHVATLTSTFGGELDLPAFGIPGGIGSPNVAEPLLSTAANQGGPPDLLTVNHGPNLRMIVTFDAAGKPSAEVVIPGGQSGIPGAPHFADQVADWAAGRYRKLLFTKEEVEAAKVSTTVFSAGAK